MLTLSVALQGIGWWTPAMPDWPSARAALRGAPVAAPTAARPSAALLPPNERRRASDSVLMALQVADEACRAAAADRSALTSVFTHAHGDLAIVDALARTLAADPALLSPLRFHHSVHNAASGYWAIAAANRCASTALAAGAHSFAAGLLEALTQCAADTRPVLLVGCDTEATGPLRSVNGSRGLLAVALLLAPAPSPGRALQAALVPATEAPPLPDGAAAPLAEVGANAMADALPLFAALSDSTSTSLQLPLGGALALALTLGPG